MGAVMVSEETPASTKKHLSQAWKSLLSGHWAGWAG